MKSREKGVLVAGAGPVGLVAANVLADAGIPVTVFESEPVLSKNLRASTFQPSTLDMLSRFGLNSRLMEMGLKAPRMQYRDRSGWMAEFDFGVIAGHTAHPYRLQCEQFKLNQLLADRLARFPHASLQFSSKAVAVSQDGDGVAVTVEGPNGRREVEGAWLIGTDGGRSNVRDALGIPLGGFTWPERFLVASTSFDFSQVVPNLSNVSYFADPDEWFFLLRVPGVWRVMVPVGSDESEAEVLSDASIQRRLRRIFEREDDFDIQHRTLYSVHQRVAERYRQDRAFLAGDAAHLNNPLGGMGMNGGIHDAFNLAGKLAAVCQGQASAASLDSYEQERRPVALEYVDRITTANKKNLETRDPAHQKAWREEMSRAAADPDLAREYLLRVSMITSLTTPDRESASIPPSVPPRSSP